ncbi:MAG: zinc-binding alcohol dehydrogenase family protein [Deltaproteobacteria bacterium]|nr:zinc-binding alcohol dehydrogenase family protein [Deltaproteobacteria bacterium]
MKAAVYYKTGDPSVLCYQDVEDPKCGPDDVVIEVKAISVEGGDVLNRAGGTMETNPHCVGYQAAGNIIQVGERVTNREVGQRVTTVNMFGSHAEKRAVPAFGSWVLPDEMSFKKAVCVPITFGTAHDCLFEFGKLQKDQTVLIHAGAGGVGVAAIQLASRAGARVLAPASSPERLEELKHLGLDEGINYREDDFVSSVRKLTDNKGANLIIDPVGGDVLKNSLSALAYRGHVITFGNAGRDFCKFDISPLLMNNQSLSGYFQGAEIFTERMQNLISQLLAEVADGKLQVVLDREYPLAEASKAHAFIESRRAVGRVLLIP